MEPIAIGDLLDGKYVIEGMLGEGAMGLVFAARHQALNKRVAIKTLRAEIARDVGLVGRFEQEARAASAIGHPNIIEVFDLGSAPNGARYMVMEYLQGQSLAELISAQPYQSAERAVFLMAQVLSALGAAHKQGIVHRDLKPENIFVVCGEDRQETVKLLDFGISKVLSEIADPRIAGTNSDARATRLGMVMGTPLYMAPEQARGLLDLDHRVDLWAVAVVLYELMCGRPPFDGENYNQILGAILQGELPPPRTYCPQIAPALEALILRGMAYDREDRFQSAAEMRQALGLVLTYPEAPRPPAGNVTAPLSLQRTTPSPSSVPVRALPDAAPAELELDGFSSDALSLAGAGSAESEAAMLSALDRIAGGDAEIGLGPSAEPAPRPVVPVAAAMAAPSSQAPRGAVPAARTDRFAPPEAESQDLVLELAGPAARRSAARPPSAANRSSTVPHESSSAARDPGQLRRATGATTASRGPGLPIGKVAVVLVALCVLGAGGVAAHRYATKGYLLEPPAAPPVQIRVSTTPAEAEVRVDGIAAPGRSLSLAPGSSARVRALAPGRMSREILVTAEGPGVPPVQLALPHRLGPSSPQLAADRDGLPGAAIEANDAAMDQMLAKLDQYVECLIPIAAAVAAARDEYRRVTGGSASKIKRNNVPVLRRLPLEAVSVCRDNLEAASRAPPLDPSIDQPAASLMKTLDELDAMLEDLGGYYTQERYFNDDLRYGRKMHRGMLQALDGSWNALTPLASAVAERRDYWQRVELESIARSEGETAHWHLRRLALSVQRWQGSVARSRGIEPRARELRAAFDQAVAYATDHAAELEDVEGAEPYLAAVKELLGRMAERTFTATEAFQRGEACIAAFNVLVL